MTQRLHLVFGGELTDPTTTVFRDCDEIDIVGIYPTYAAAYVAWKAKAQATVDATGHPSADLRARLDLYRHHRPYREPMPATRPAGPKSHTTQP